MSTKKWLSWASEIQAIAQTGGHFTESPFDQERYQRLTAIAAEMLADIGDTSTEKIQQLFRDQVGYATPRVSVRAFVLREEKILMVRERQDDKWTLPGGWADVTISPADNVVKEVMEESGYLVTPKRLLAVWDDLKRDHSPQWPHIYNLFFHCQILKGRPQPNIEISEIDFFDVKDLPPLSTPRVTKSEIIRLYELVHTGCATVFD